MMGAMPLSNSAHISSTHAVVVGRGTAGFFGQDGRKPKKSDLDDTTRGLYTEVEDMKKQLTAVESTLAEKQTVLSNLSGK